MVYSINGKQFQKKWGDKKSVWSGESYWTRGLLTKSDLCLNARRVVVSKKKSDASKVRYEKQGFKKVSQAQVEVESKPGPKLSVKEKLEQLKAKRRLRYRKPEQSQPPISS